MENVITSNNRTLKIFIIELDQSNASNKSNLYEDLLSSTKHEEFPFALKYGIEFTIALSVAYLLVFIAGVFGNVAVFFIVKRTPRMRTLTNQFIANLAAADLLVIIVCLPFSLAGNIFPAWHFGALFCKFVPYLQGVSVSASVNSLMAISIDRCMAISCPLSPTKSKRHYIRVMFAIWIIALTINLPWLYVFKLEPMENGSSLQICIELWPTPELDSLFFIFANVIICYLGPLVVISVCYILIWIKVKQRNVPGDNNRHQSIVNSVNRSRLKVAKMVFVVILTFAISWLPLYTIFIFIKFCDKYHQYENVRSTLHLAIPIAQWLGASNSCINPILFAYMNKSFRISLMKIFSKVFCSQRFVDEDEIHLRNFSSKGNYKSKGQSHLVNVNNNGRTVSLRIYNSQNLLDNE